MTDDASTDGRTQDRTLGDGLVGNLLAGNGIRAYAALTIFAGHVAVNADPGQSVENYGWAKDLLGHLDIGLMAFFVLSGYLVTRPFVRSYVLATPRPSVRRYARNRVLRIVPAFYLIAALVLLRFGLDGAIGPTPDNPSGTGPPSSLVQVLSVFTFTQSYTGGSATLPIGQAWTLDAEAAFYVLIPFAAAVAFALGGRLGSPRRRTQAALAVVGLLFLVSIWLRQGSRDTFALLTSPPLIAFVFLPGVALALAEPFAIGWLRAEPRRARLVAWAAAVAAALAFALYAAWDYNAQTTAMHHALGRRALLAAIFGTAVVGGVLALQIGTGRGPRWLCNRPIAYLGERSYAFYLLHVWVLFEIIDAAGAGAGTATLVIAMVAVGLPLTLGASALSWRYVERPFLERRLPWAREQVPSASEPAAEPGPRPSERIAT